MRTLTDGCYGCGMSAVYCKCVAYIENGRTCCEQCAHRTPAPGE